MAKRFSLLVHHTHPYSPQYAFTEDKTDKMEKEVSLYYDDFVRTLPEGYDVVFTKTDHWVPRSEIFGKLKDKLEKRRDSYGKIFDKHLYGEIDGKRFAVINGVEASAEKKDYHFTLNGLKIGEEKKYKNLEMEELYKEARKAEFTCLAHPLTPGVSMPDRMIEKFLEKSKDDEKIVPGIEVAKGYSTVINFLSLGLHRKMVGKKSLFDYADEYGVPLIPETDWHAHFPKNLRGVGKIDEESMEKLFNGDIPTENILDSEYDHMDCKGLSIKEHLESYPKISSRLKKFVNVPEKTGDYQEILETTFKKIRKSFNNL